MVINPTTGITVHQASIHKFQGKSAELETSWPLAIFHPFSAFNWTKSNLKLLYIFNEQANNNLQEIVNQFLIFISSYELGTYTHVDTLLYTAHTVNNSNPQLNPLYRHIGEMGNCIITEHKIIRVHTNPSTSIKFVLIFYQKWSDINIITYCSGIILLGFVQVNTKSAWKMSDCYFTLLLHISSGGVWWCLVLMIWRKWKL